MNIRTKVLVAHTDPSIEGELAGVLSELGYEVLDILDTAEGLDSADRLKPDVILTDSILKIRLQDVPVILVGSPSSMPAASGAAVARLRRPFNKEVVRVTIETELYRIEVNRKLQMYETWINAAFDNLGEGVIMVNQSGTILQINKRAMEIMGAAQNSVFRAQADGMAHFLTRDRVEVDNPFRQVIHSGNALRHDDGFLLLPHGAEVPVDFRIIPILKDGAVLGALAVVREVRERRAAELHISKKNFASDLQKTPMRNSITN